MSDLILLKQKSRCPVCAADIYSLHLPTNCRNCGILLFYGHQDFEKYEQQTGWREYWVFFREGGWKHRTHILDFDGKPINRNTALDRVVESSNEPVLSPKEKLKKIREQTKAKQRWYLASKKKIKSFAK